MSGMKEFLQRETGHFMSLMEVLTRMSADGSSHRDAASVLYGLLWHSRERLEWVVKDPTGLWIAEDEDTKKPWECLNKAAHGHDKRALDRFGFFAGVIIPFLAKHGIDISVDQSSAPPAPAGAQEQADSATPAARDVQEQESDASPAVSGEAPAQTDTTHSGASEVEILRKRSALIAEFAGMWTTIERDLKDSKRGGLTAAAKAGHGYWKVREALNWAAERGRIKPEKAEAFVRAEGENEMSVLVRAIMLNYGSK